MWSIDFISEEDFTEHVRNTIKQYGKKLKPFDLAKFNHNTIDPIKMLFDKAVYGESWEQLIDSEIFRQRDKAGNNDIGYFHQRMFQYISNCHVPDNGKEGGWDIIYRPEAPYRIDDYNAARTVYVEMKNKHNTMNAASQSDTYIKMQAQLLNDPDSCCFLVEVIAAQHQNIEWVTHISQNGERRPVRNKRIRRVSIDEFYSIVTGEDDAFYQICLALPYVINNVMKDNGATLAPQDTVISELEAQSKRFTLESQDMSMLMALYMLGFGTYNGFRDVS